MSDVTLMAGEEIVEIELVDSTLPSELPDHRYLIDLMTKGNSRPPVAALGSGDSEALARFVVVFGRDALLISDLIGDPELTDRTLTYLAERQGLSRESAPEAQYYDARHEQAGRILHEERDPTTDEIARRLTAEEGWRWPIYATDDATPLFVKLLAERAIQNPELLERCIVQRDGVERTMADALNSAVKWMLGRLDSVDGLFYTSRSVFDRPDGSRHIGFYPIWQDSFDSAVRKDGDLATGPVAFVEVQAQVFDALIAAGALVDCGYDTEVLLRASRKLRRSLLKHFVVNDSHGQFFALGLEKRSDRREPLAVRKSNAAHLLDSAIFDGHKYSHWIEMLVSSVYSQDSGLRTRHGIRTMSQHEKSFRVGGYHTGTIWLWEQAVMARGLERHGFSALANWQETSIVKTCESLAHYPEFIRGEDSVDAVENVAITRIRSYDPSFGTWMNTASQPGQVFQGWTVAAYNRVLPRVTEVRTGSTVEPSSALESDLLEVFVNGSVDLDVSASDVA